MKEKISDGLFKLKSYWKVPPKGYDVSYKEFLNFTLGLGGISFMSILITYTAIATSTYMMISYFGVSTGLVWILGIATSIISIIRSPILSKIIDNSHSKNGKFKPFLMIGTIGTCLCFGLIPFIPSAWCAGEIFSIKLPAIPLFGITEAENIHISLGVIILFLLTQVGGFFTTLVNQAAAGVEQTISTVAQERANIGALKGFICYIPASVVNVVIPILVGLFFTQEGVDNSVNGYNNINLYRIIFPICAIGGAALMLFMVKGTKERAVVNNQKIQKSSFVSSAKSLLKNKYFWIITIFNCIAGIRYYANIATWITQYTYETGLGKTIIGLYCSTLVMNVYMIGMAFGPMLIKKFGKKTILLFANIGYALVIGVQFLFYNSPIMILVTLLLQNVFAGFGFVAIIMVSDVLDFHQYKTGKRMEGAWQNLTVIVATIIGFGTSILLPLFLQMAGVGFSDNISDKLSDESTRYEIYKYQTLLALIASVICVVPMLFYNLSEKKHADIIRVLKLRVAIDSDNVDELSDKNILDLHEVMQYSKNSHDEFLQKELTEDNLQKINNALLRYNEVSVRVEEETRKSKMGDFVRECELGLKKVATKISTLSKKDNNINIAELTKELKLKHRYLKFFVGTDIEKYDDIESIVQNIEEIYAFYEQAQSKE